MRNHKKVVVAAGIVVFILLFAWYFTPQGKWPKTYNENPPEYVKQLTAYREGDGLAVYFILADGNGKMTTSDGHISIEIRSIPTDWGEIEEIEEKYARKLGTSRYYLSDYGKKQAMEKAERILLSWSTSIRKEEFVRTKIGEGPFQKEAILYSFGRIPYQSMHAERNQMGKVKLGFKTGNQTFHAEETFYF